jgi:hypothetical protein
VTGAWGRVRSDCSGTAEDEETVDPGCYPDDVSALPAVWPLMGLDLR